MSSAQFFAKPVICVRVGVVRFTLDETDRGIEAARLDEVSSRVQPQCREPQRARFTFQILQEEPAHPLTSGSWFDKDPGHLTDIARANAHSGTAEHGAPLAGEQQQPGWCNEVVAWVPGPATISC